MAPNFGLQYLLSLVSWTNKQKGFETSGNSRTGAEVRAIFKVSNAFTLVSVLIRGLIPHFVLVYRGLTFSTNSDIQRQQYLAAPTNSQTCVLVFGVGS